MTATELRKQVRAKYEEIIGRNQYSQSKRDFCFKKASDGKYYSDCSSSVSYTYREVLGKDRSFGILNTAGMYNATGKKFTQVPVKISKGQITNPEVLCIGDMLLYAGTDNSRPGCVGHVEMYWGYDSKGTHWVVGHGSGTPKKTRMTEKNASRYNAKTGTKVGNKGLIRVIRYIQGDGTLGVPNTGTTSAPVKDEPAKVTTGARVAAGAWNLRVGPGKEYDPCGTVSGGAAVEIVTRLTDVSGWMFVKVGGQIGFISEKTLEGV